MVGHGRYMTSALDITTPDTSSSNLCLPRIRRPYSPRQSSGQLEQSDKLVSPCSPGLCSTAQLPQRHHRCSSSKQLAPNPELRHQGNVQQQDHSWWSFLDHHIQRRQRECYHHITVPDSFRLFGRIDKGFQVHDCGTECSILYRNSALRCHKGSCA